MGRYWTLTWGLMLVAGVGGWRRPTSRTKAAGLSPSAEQPHMQCISEKGGLAMTEKKNAREWIGNRALVCGGTFR